MEELNTPGRGRAAVQVERSEPRREWLTYREAGEIVGLSRVTLWKLACSRAIKARHVGRAVRISRASLDAYMNEEPAGE